MNVCSSESKGYSGLLPPKQIPQRTCIGCRRKEDQHRLIRIARDVDGRLGLWTGKGRSAYMHPLTDCIESALAKGKLERVLKSTITPQEREVLREELACQPR